ncbi:hypothetical protein [Flavihumibacter profundi]|uniref:hypothetical protein n=1 Tax=Flavihumibacter profundi TaxID=2716883 RepID=UPI001CC5B234|nr:hypothetical protein [Flavihumibacter profundi]MBZ5856084.1 hypothetical protein [Flavihumibacter profundi]
MKKFIALILVALLFIGNASAQKDIYTTTGGELIFSFANIEQNGNNGNSIMRFAPVFNIQTWMHADISNKFGFFTGLAFRNVGYIYGDYKTNTQEVLTYKKKFRSYNLGVPLGIKIGNMDGTFFYAGYEVELPVFYKEKTFDGGDKIDKITGFFSNRENLFQHGFLVGVQGPYGVNLKFKYYLSEFHNQDFVDAAGIKPYAGLKSNIFYFSLSTFFFRDFKTSSSSTEMKSFKMQQL